MPQFRPLGTLASSLVLFLSTSAVRGEHAKINLNVETPVDRATAFVDQTPPAFGKNPRPVVRARVGQPVRVEWLMTNVYPHKTLENVVVHFYVAPQDEVGQEELPELGEDVVVEMAFDMDFKPGANAGARTTIRIDRPGAYLIRIESLRTDSDHEHFAAVDLVIEHQ